VLKLAERYPGARGLKSLRIALPLVDRGAASPKETWLRLVFIDAGLPKPMTQRQVFDGHKLVRVLDMCWEEFMVGAEYDGDQHRTSRKQYAKDVQVKRKLARLGWNVTYVIKEDHRDDIVKSAWDAMVARGWRP
jgi:very-short-patch-repair endonuclease